MVSRTKGVCRAQAVRAQGRPSPATAAASITWPARYVKLLIDDDVFERSHGGQLQPEMLLGSLAAATGSSTLARSRKVKGWLTALERQQGIAARWTSATAEFQAGHTCVHCHLC